MIKIIYYSDALETGGAELFMASVAKGIPDDEYKKIMISRDPNNMSGMNIRAIHVPRGVWNLPFLVEIFRKEAPDILHLNFHVPFSNITALVAAKIAGIHNIVGSFYSVKTLSSKTFIVRWLKWLVSVFIVRSVKVAVCDSKYGAETLVKDYHLDPKKVTVVYFGFDIPNPVVRDIHKDRPVVTIMARIVKDKGHLGLLKAFVEVVKKFPLAKLVVIGDGPLRSSVEIKALQLGLSSNIEFTGALSGAEKHTRLSESDVFVLPSMHESLPQSVLQAMSLSIPVISSSVGDIPLLLGKEECGSLIEPGDVDGLAKAIIRLLDHPEDAILMGMRGKEKASNYTYQKMINGYKKVYETSV